MKETNVAYWGLGEVASFVNVNDTILAVLNNSKIIIAAAGGAIFIHICRLSPLIRTKC